MTASPLIALVVPTYDVARYLPDFLGSLDAQRGGLDDVEVVFVDDGSTDGSGALVEAWAARDPASRRVVRQSNAGAAAARNTGLDLVSAPWLSFPDPDDVLAPDYLELVREALAEADGEHASLIATHLVVLDDRTGRVSDTHPLRGKYVDGRRAFDLERYPQWLHMQAGSAFVRRSRVEELGLRFDPRIRPNFEDSSFLAHYLASYPRPRMFVLPAAHYRYRVRGDNTSQVQASWSRPEKYTLLPEVGHLALLRTVRDTRGRVPVWLQNTILYELAWYLRTDARPNSPTPGLAPEVVARFFELLPEVLAFVDSWVIDAFRTTWISEDMRAVLVTGVKGERPRPHRVWVDALDAGRQLVRVRYYFAGEPPEEQFRSRGLLVSPVHQKIRVLRFLGRPMLFQRIAWLPATGTLSVTLDGARTEVELREERRVYNATPQQLWQELAGREPPTALETARARPRPRTARARLGTLRREARARRDRLRRTVDRVRHRDPAAARTLLAEAATRPVRRRYRDAWLFMDRDSFAQDNAERLYRWVRENQRSVNAFFVLSRDSADWDRLAADGFRLVEYGSAEHTLALLNCRNLVSSQIDGYVVDVLDPKVYGPPSWHFTFLQHGVTKDDLSTWLDSKSIDLLVTATPDEQESFVADGTSYRWTTHEVSMTGFPRHDRLLELGRACPPERRTRILVAPTWRRDLLRESTVLGNDRELLEDFWQSEYATAWREVLESGSLARAAADHGLTIEFVPHPNMQDYLATSPLPEHVVVRRFADVDIQQVLAETAVLVTDYSSLAFEAAYLERPVVYDQFDRDRFWDGSHAYRRGTWSYDDDGFGPVLTDSAAAVAAVVELVERGCRPEPVYAARMAAAFPLRDGRCCERTFTAIRDLDVPLRHDELYLPLESPQTLSGAVNDDPVGRTRQ